MKEELWINGVLPVTRQLVDLQVKDEVSSRRSLSLSSYEFDGIKDLWLVWVQELAVFSATSGGKVLRRAEQINE